MKRFTSFLLALVAAVSILGPQPATAETLTLQNLKNLTFGSNQLNALVKPRLVAFEAGLLAGAATLTNLAATTVGKGASLIGIYDVASKITATTVEGALAEIAADNWVTSARIAAGAVTFGDMSTNACTMGQVPAVNAGATAWECSTPTTGDITGVTAATGGGIEGGGSSGSVSIGLLTTCMDNQILKWDTVGSAWGCEADQDTTYAVMVGDTGTGGTAGLVPAPAAGDAAAGKYLKADGTWTAPASGGLATSTSVTTATIRGAAVVTRVGASTGTAAISGDSKRTGDLTIEITVNGEADGGVAKFKWYFGSEVASADIDVTTAGIAITAGVTVAFTNGGPLSFETGDKFVFPVSWETELSGFDCGIITIPHMDTPGTGGVGKEDVLVHWDATRIASANVPVVVSIHTSAAGMLVVDARATAHSEARFTILNWSGGDWSDKAGTVTLCRP
jgi:hypothetical protein